MIGDNRAQATMARKASVRAEIARATEAVKAEVARRTSVAFRLAQKYRANPTKANALKLNENLTFYMKRGADNYNGQTMGAHRNILFIDRSNPIFGWAYNDAVSRGYIAPPKGDSPFQVLMGAAVASVGVIAAAGAAVVGGNAIAGALGGTGGAAGAGAGTGAGSGFSLGLSSEAVGTGAAAETGGILGSIGTAAKTVSAVASAVRSAKAMGAPKKAPNIAAARAAQQAAMQNAVDNEVKRRSAILNAEISAKKASNDKNNLMLIAGAGALAAGSM